jgi:hypothetical protein
MPLLLSEPSPCSGNAPDVLRVFHAAKRICAKDKDDAAIDSPPGQRHVFRLICGELTHNGSMSSLEEIP